MSLLTRSSRLEDPVDFPPVKPGDIKFVEVFPPLGVARLGDSTKEYFLGPELPIDNDERANLSPTKDNKFRDAEGNIRRQAARFRVYAYDENHKILGEVNLHNGYTLEWTVQVANIKAAGYNIEEPLEKKRNPGIQGDLEPHKRTDLIAHSKETIVRTDGNDVKQLNHTFKGTFLRDVTVNLGQLQVDNAGRLVFIGAKGAIFGEVPTSTSSLDNPNCLDDACDGWVDVTVKHRGDGNEIHAGHKAAVLSGPPKYSWDLRTTTSILDLIENVYQGNAPIKTPEFNVDIWPILEAPSLLSWVDRGAYNGHRSDTNKDGDFLSRRGKLEAKDEESKVYKGRVFRRIKNPAGGGGTMPKLEGDSVITKLQYGRFSLWKELDFNVTPLKTVAQLEKMELAEQPKCLTRANLEMTIGASFEPGIEACNRVKDSDIYDVTITPTILDPPYRLNFSKVFPGDLTVGLAVPWQADFEQCNTSWWPAVRPNDVKTNTDPGSPFVKWERGAEDGKMLKNWHLLGFIRRPLLTANTRIEQERNLPGAA